MFSDNFTKSETYTVWYSFSILINFNQNILFIKPVQRNHFLSQLMQNFIRDSIFTFMEWQKKIFFTKLLLSIKLTLNTTSCCYLQSNWFNKWIKKTLSSDNLFGKFSLYSGNSSGKFPLKAEEQTVLRILWEKMLRSDLHEIINLLERYLHRSSLVL